MTVVNPKSISGINSITMASGSDNLLTIHTTNTTERVRINSSGDVIVGSGITLSQDGDIFTTGITTFTNDVKLDGGNLVFGDSGGATDDRLTFGAGTDLSIYHNGSNSYIDDSGTGNLFIRSNEVRINKYTNEYMIRAIADGAVELYHDNTKRFETTSSGVTVTGGLTATTGTFTGDVDIADKIVHTGDTDTLIRFPSADTIRFDTGGTEAARINSAQKLIIGDTNSDAQLGVYRASYNLAEFTNTNADATGAEVALRKDSSSPADGDVLGMLKFIGDNDAGEKVNYAYIQSKSSDVSDSTEDGRLEFYTRGAGTLAERLRIDSSGNLGINNTSPTHKLDIDNGTAKVNRGNSSGEILILRGLNADKFRFDTDGLKFGTDTAAANALDDYEEGTWTPTNTIGLTLTNNNPAYYIKIGKLVMIQFDVSFSGASDTAQCGVIQSLPFTSENTTNHFSQGPLPHISTNSNFDLDPNLDDLLLFIGPDESRIDIFSFSINAQAARSSLVGRRIRHQMIYKAA